jgi:hypothetical protein
MAQLAAILILSAHTHTKHSKSHMKIDDEDVSSGNDSKYNRPISFYLQNWGEQGARLRLQLGARLITRDSSIQVLMANGNVDSRSLLSIGASISQ